MGDRDTLLSLMSTRRHVQIRVTRDLVLFVVGVFGIIWQTVIEDIDRPYLLAIFAGCVGLPVYLASMPRQSAADEKESPQ